MSLDYPKSPTHRYPVAVHALIDTINAVLDDDMLPIDKTRVAIGRFSAGANLAFAVCQDESLQGKIKAVVAYYPLVNFLPIGEEDGRGSSNGHKLGSVLSQDRLTMLIWGYVKEGQDLTDPRLSLTHAEPDKLPGKMYFAGCELDLLCREAEIMAEKMAGIPSPETGVGEVAWDRNGVRWEMVLGEDHGMYKFPITIYSIYSYRYRKAASEICQG